MLQETWLRWAEVDHDDVRDARAYLVRITTRLSLNRLRTVQRQREAYVGPWLPEPLLTTPDVAEDVELADSVSIAMLLVLETLTPTERAVFVLREVFDLPTTRSPRPSTSRRPRSGRSRTGPATTSTPGSRGSRCRCASARRWSSGSSRPRAAGDLQSLMDVLAPDVVLVTDGGGKKQRRARPILGRDKVLRFLAGCQRPAGSRRSVVPSTAHPALCVLIDGESTPSCTFLVEDGSVTGMYVVRNPEKLGRLEEPVSLAR